MAFDYKKEYKEFYMPPKKPSIVDVPAMNYIAVRGKGDEMITMAYCLLYPIELLTVLFIYLRKRMK